MRLDDNNALYLWQLLHHIWAGIGLLFIRDPLCPILGTWQSLMYNRVLGLMALLLLLLLTILSLQAIHERLLIRVG